MALFVDKLRIANILVEGEVPREQAKEFAEAISAALQPAATVEEVEDRVETLDTKTDARFEAMMARMDARFAEMDARFAEMRGEMDARFAEMRGEMDARFAEMNARFAQFEVRIYRAIGAATALIIAAMSALAAFG